MRDDPAKRLAISLMHTATVCDLRTSAAELTALLDGLDDPGQQIIPPLSPDPEVREAQLIRMWLYERERARQLVRLFAG